MTDDEICHIKDEGEWSKNPRYVATLGFNDKDRYEVPSLEEYLIMKLSPKDNTNGKIK